MTLFLCACAISVEYFYFYFHSLSISLFLFVSCHFSSLSMPFHLKFMSIAFEQIEEKGKKKTKQTNEWNELNWIELARQKHETRKLNWNATQLKDSIWSSSVQIDKDETEVEAENQLGLARTVFITFRIKSNVKQYFFQSFWNKTFFLLLLLMFTRVSWILTMLLCVLLICLKALRVPLELNIYSSVLWVHARARNRKHTHTHTHFLLHSAEKHS